MLFIPLRTAGSIAVLLLLLLGSMLMPRATPNLVIGDPSTIRADERVVFFETVAPFDPVNPKDPRAGRWIVDVHGWIHEPVDSTVRKGALEELLDGFADLEVTPEQRARFDRRVDLFLVDNERGKRILTEVGTRSAVLPASTPDGHFHGTVELTSAEATANAVRKAIPVRATAADGRVFRGRVRLVAPTGVSVISDIDDTVKVSEVTDKKRLLARTFAEEYEAAPGMPDLYQKWRAAGATLHYVSSSPWHLYEPIVEFMDRVKLPHDSLHLKLVRLKDSTIADLFAPGTETKPRAIAPILAAFPKRKFVLVGDSGEQDPEVYAALLKEHPEQVVRIAIRNVTSARRDDARFRPLFEGIGSDRWALFTDPHELEGWISEIQR